MSEYFHKKAARECQLKRERDAYRALAVEQSQALCYEAFGYKPSEAEAGTFVDREMMRYANDGSGNGHAR